MNLLEKQAAFRTEIEELLKKYSHLSPHVAISRLNLFESSFFENVEYEEKKSFQARYGINAVETNTLLDGGFQRLREITFDYKPGNEPNENADAVTSLDQVAGTLQRMIYQLKRQIFESNSMSLKQFDSELVRGLEAAILKLNKVKNTLDGRSNHETSKLVDRFYSFMENKLSEYNKFIEQKEKECAVSQGNPESTDTGPAGETPQQPEESALQPQEVAPQPEDDILSILEKNNSLDQDYDFNKK